MMIPALFASQNYCHTKNALQLVRRYKPKKEVSAHFSTMNASEWALVKKATNLLLPWSKITSVSMFLL